MKTEEADVVYTATMEEYCSWFAASNSALTQIKRSPLHCLEAMREPYKETDAQRLGSAVHAAILEPETFVERYDLLERCTATTKQGKQCSKMGVERTRNGEFLCATHGPLYEDERDSRKMLSPKDWSLTRSMAEAVHMVPAVHNLLESLEHFEASIRWDDAEGFACKARLDGISRTLPGGCIVDLKTTRDASPEAFQKTIYQYGYHRQGAFYMEAAEAGDLAVRHYVMLAVENERPHGVALYLLDQPSLDRGREELAELRTLFARCVETGEWPGYSDQVVDIGLPEWVWKS